MSLKGHGGCLGPAPKQGPGSTHFNGPLHLGLLVAEPHHPDDGQGDAEPVEEAEEVYDGVDVVGEGVEERHEALDTAETNK